MHKPYVCHCLKTSGKYYNIFGEQNLHRGQTISQSGQLSLWLSERVSPLIHWDRHCACSCRCKIETCSN